MKPALIVAVGSIFVLLIGLIIGMSLAGGGGIEGMAVKYAEKLCACLTESGFVSDERLSVQDAGAKLLSVNRRDEFLACFLRILDEGLGELQTRRLDDAELGDLARRFAVAIFNTDCARTFMRNLEFGDSLEKLALFAAAGRMHMAMKNGAGPPKNDTPLPAGARCSTSHTRSLRGRPPRACASGLVCQITDPGAMERDVPNSGTCIARTLGAAPPKGGWCCPKGYVLGYDPAPRCTSQGRGLVAEPFACGDLRLTLSDTHREYPRHWGPPPTYLTKDLVNLPGGYGRGSSTTARWIMQKMKEDSADKIEAIKGPRPGLDRRPDDGKSIGAWPGLVGKSASEATAKIYADRPDLLIQTVPRGAAVSSDYITNRVRIRVDEDGVVTHPPSIG